LIPHRYPTLPPLHSFPTRRSSDLIRSIAQLPHQRPFQEELSEHVQSVRKKRAQRAARYKTGGFASRTSPYTAAKIDSRFGFDQRSEEHTSELQSLRHLVCRLLLEK